MPQNSPHGLTDWTSCIHETIAVQQSPSSKIELVLGRLVLSRYLWELVGVGPDASSIHVSFSFWLKCIYVHSECVKVNESYCASGHCSP